MIQQDKLVFLGVISAAYGIKGEVLIKTFNAYPKQLPEMHIVRADNSPIKLQFIRMHPKGGIIVKPENCHTRSAAEKLAKTKLYCSRNFLPETEEDEFYITDLEGMKVVTTEYKSIGKVIAVHNFGAGDILEIEFIDSGKKEMFPFDRDFFPEVADDYIVATCHPIISTSSS